MEGVVPGIKGQVRITYWPVEDKDQKKPKGLRTVGALGLVATATETPKELQNTFDILIGELFGEFNAN